MNMRNLSITLLLSAAIASPGAAQDLTGTWEISTQGGRGGPQELEVSNGTVDGNSFSFTVTLTFQGNSIDLNYSGTVDGDEISGTRGGGQPFTGKKQG